MSQRGRDEKPLRPIGLALAAVVAGIGAPGAALGEEVARVRADADDPTNAAGFDEDPTMIVGASAPVEPFASAQPE